MSEIVVIEGIEVHLAEPMDLPKTVFIGRERELELCRAAWNGEHSGALHFRLEGLPGTGKNEIVYQLARELDKPIFAVQGHEELTPEDLALLIVPQRGEGGESDDGAEARSFLPLPLVVRASPLATALYKGGLFFFDEINRASERALSPLASVLDDRKELYSALAGIWIKPKDPQAAASFRFACALNRSFGQDLPEYIAQRTLPRIEVEPAGLEDLVRIVETNVDVPANRRDRFNHIRDSFQEWYAVNIAAQTTISTRQAIHLFRYSMKLADLEQYRGCESEAFHEAVQAVVGAAGRKRADVS